MGLLDRGLTALQQFDFTGLAENLEDAKAEAARRDAEQQQRRDDEGEDLWQGLRGKRR